MIKGKLYDMSIKIAKLVGSALAGVLAAATVGLPLCGPAQASPVVLNFDGLSDGEYVNSYYAGGLGSLGSGPGPNYGVTFTSDGFVGSGTGSLAGIVLNAPSAPNVLAFDGTGTATMNVAVGFTSGLSFYYASLTVPAVVNVYAGLNDSGAVLATLNLPFTPDGSSDPACGAAGGSGGAPFCTFSFASLFFSGTAMSVDLASGAAGFTAFDDITVGATSVGVPTPIAGTGLPAMITVLGGGGLLARWRRKRKASGALAAA
jgi:hypothetical protein